MQEIAALESSNGCSGGHRLRKPPHGEDGDIVLLAEGLGGVGNVEGRLVTQIVNPIEPE